ncbi:MAG TPA: hypothetical protein PKJ08_00100 [Candidatus Cloacimonadota bacterium]|nr:hypothetical protein [Candidatus Cloacimonadota bacterium]
MINWLTAASATFTRTYSPGSGYTRRQLIPSSDISNSGRPYTRVTFNNSISDISLSLNPVYIGQKADSGDAYDFQTTPVELKFSGSSGFSIAAGQTITSDPALFTIPTGKDLLISFYESGSSRLSNGVKNGWNYYYKAGNDAATVNATGYAAFYNTVLSISLIEAGILSGGGIGISPYPILTKRWWQGWRQKDNLWQPKEIGLKNI